MYRRYIKLIYLSIYCLATPLTTALPSVESDRNSPSTDNVPSAGHRWNPIAIPMLTVTCFISMPAVFRRHLVGKTLINVCRCDNALIQHVWGASENRRVSSNSFFRKSPPGPPNYFSISIFPTASFPFQFPLTTKTVCTTSVHFCSLYEYELTTVQSYWVLELLLGYEKFT